MGILESALVGFYGIFAFDSNFSDNDMGRFIGLYGCGMFIFSGIVWITNLKIIAMSNSFNFLILGFTIGSIIVFKLFFLAASRVKGITVSGFMDVMMTNESYYIGIAIVVAATYMPTFAYKRFLNFDQNIKMAKIAKIMPAMPRKSFIPIEKEVLELVDLTKDEETPVGPRVNTPLRALKSSSDTTTILSENQSP